MIDEPLVALKTLFFKEKPSFNNKYLKKNFLKFSYEELLSL